MLGGGGPAAAAAAAVEAVVGGQVVLVVQGRHIPAHRRTLALVSNFFKALFRHKFEDSNKAVLVLDTSGEMGLTDTAIQVLTTFAQTGRLEICVDTAVQIFIAADALDVESARVEAEGYLGSRLLSKESFPTFWHMTRQFHMKILQTFLDRLVLENFGWFSSTQSVMVPYLSQWELEKISTLLLQKQFKNCSEEQVFQAVVSYCRYKGQSTSLETLIPGLYKSCSAYLRYIQSVPRTLTYRSSS